MPRSTTRPRPSRAAGGGPNPGAPSPAALILSTLLALLALLGAGAALAQGSAATAAPLTLEQALGLGPDASADVLAARSSLAAAQRDEQRVSADPASLRVDRLTATNAVAAAQAKLDAAVAANRVRVASAYFDALEADTALSVARLDQDIQQQTLAAEQTRRDAGAATDLDVAKAQNALDASRSTVADADTQRTLAFATLGSLLGTDVSALAPVTDTPALDAVDTYVQQAHTANAQLLAARNAVALAQARYEASNNDFTARSAIESAKDAVSDAQLTLQETNRTLELSIRNAYATATAAAAALANASSSDATAAQDLATAKTRLDAGAIAPLTYRSSELTRAKAAQSLESARHAYLLRLYQLQQATYGN